MKTVVIQTDRLADFDRSLFGVDEIDEEEIILIAEKVAQKVMQAQFHS